MEISNAKSDKEHPTVNTFWNKGSFINDVSNGLLKARSSGFESNSKYEF